MDCSSRSIASLTTSLRARVAGDVPQVGRYLVPLYLQMPQHLQPASPTGRQVETHDEHPRPQIILDQAVAMFIGFL